MPYTPNYTYSGTTSALDLSRSFFGDINYVANSNEEMILSDQEYANFQTVYNGLTVEYGVACLTAILEPGPTEPGKVQSRFRRCGSGLDGAVEAVAFHEVRASAWTGANAYGTWIGGVNREL